MTQERKPGTLIPDDGPLTISLDQLWAQRPKPLCTDEQAMEAYRHLLAQAMEHGSSSSRDIAAILLNLYNENLPGTAFSVGRFRYLDMFNRRAVLHYLDWIGAAGGRYPSDDDMDVLRDRWIEMGWGDLGRND